MNITMREAMTIAGEACGNRCDMRVVPAYNGRGMYGETCLGFAGDFSLLTLGITLRNLWTSEDAYEAAENALTDDLGMGTIVYFPGITVTDHEDYEEGVDY